MKIVNWIAWLVTCGISGVSIQVFTDLKALPVHGYPEEGFSAGPSSYRSQ